MIDIGKYKFKLIILYFFTLGQLMSHADRLVINSQVIDAMRLCYESS